MTDNYITIQNIHT